MLKSLMPLFAMSKKKLSGKPIRIDIPHTASIGDSDELQKQDSSKPDETILESSKKESSIQESNKQESSIQESSTAEDSLQEGYLHDSGKQEAVLVDSGNIESTKTDSSSEVSTEPEMTFQENSFPVSSSLESSKKQESTIQESGFEETEYKKVAMRLSAEATESLRQFRADTGIPYEILVDVMIRNWSKLPERTKAAYLQQAKQLRNQRLLAGQEKTMKTMREKYRSRL